MEKQHLDEIRSQLRSIDTELIDLLARRFRLVRQVAILKDKLGMGVIDPATEESAIENFVSSASTAGLDEHYARRMSSLIIEGSIEVQQALKPKWSSDDSGLKRLHEKILSSERQGRSLIRMDIGEPRFKTPIAAIEEAKRSLDEKSAMLYGSASGLPELREAIAQRLRGQYGAQISPANVLMLPGGRFAVFAAICSAVSNLDRIAVCTPAWPAYESATALVGGRTLIVPTRFENRWEPDFAELEEALRLRPKFLVLNYPNNPTGKVLSRKSFQELVHLAGKYQTVVLSDEVYATYCESSVPSILECPDVESVYVNSFSKEFSMTGWRVAYAVADEQRIARMRRIAETTITCVPEFVQRAAIASLEDRSDEAAAARRAILERVRTACTELRRRDFEFYEPDGGFYVFPHAKNKRVDSEKLAECLVMKYGVGVMPGTVFGDYQGFLRLTVTEPVAVVKEGIELISKAVDECQQE